MLISNHGCYYYFPIYHPFQVFYSYFATKPQCQSSNVKSMPKFKNLDIESFEFYLKFCDDSFKNIVIVNLVMMAYKIKLGMIGVQEFKNNTVGDIHSKAPYLMSPGM